MKKKISLVMLLAISLCLPAFAKTENENDKAEKEFQRLKAVFEDEISYPPYSDYTFTVRYWDSESGRNIIAMGKMALPFIMEEVKRGNSWYAVAAARITGIKMRGPTADDLNRQWLEWWDENKNNPDWNIFIASTVAEQQQEY